MIAAPTTAAFSAGAGVDEAGLPSSIPIEETPRNAWRLDVAVELDERTTIVVVTKQAQGAWEEERQMRAQAYAFIVLMLLAACTATPIESSSPGHPAAPSPSGSAPSSPSPGSPTPSVAAIPAPSGTPRDYTTTEFQPAFTVELPAGWTVAERAPEVAQIYQECQTCAHGGEENGEITFDMTSADMSLDEAVADLLKADNIEASAVDSAQVGTLSGKKFTATRTGPPNFRSSGYHSDPAGLPIDVYVLTVAGKTATVFVDPHEASGSAGQDFMAVAAQILESVRIST